MEKLSSLARQQSLQFMRPSLPAKEELAGEMATEQCDERTFD
jgi:hypothetical protein